MCFIILSQTAVVWNVRVRSGATWIAVYWSRPANAPYLQRVVEYVVTISGTGKLASPGKNYLQYRLHALATRSVHDRLMFSQLVMRIVAIRPL